MRRRIRLIAGRAHLKHTEGGDFREATCRAIRNALMQAENVLLEPVVRFELAMPNEALARVTGELLRIGAQLDASETDGGETTLTGRCTAAMFWDYPTRFAASTHGHGRIASRFERYEPCKNQDDIVRQSGYDPLADTLNPPGSVFFAAMARASMSRGITFGNGRTARWNEHVYVHTGSGEQNPLCEQLYTALRREMERGGIRPGERMPSSGSWRRT